MECFVYAKIGHDTYSLTRQAFQFFLRKEEYRILTVQRTLT